LKKVTNQLKILIEFIQAFDQFNPKDPASFASVFRLNDLKAKKSLVEALIEELKSHQVANKEIFEKGSDVELEKSHHDSIIEEYYHMNPNDESFEGTLELNRSEERG
jgi:hypothetical protein